MGLIRGMEARTVVDVEGWDSRPFDGLDDLASREFTGCVVAGDTYLFMTRGRVVGVFDYVEPSTGDPSLEPADIDRFEGADGTAHEAPHDALPLLSAMAATGGETRGRYYSNDTPLEEIDRTLQDGGFTGYLELSENVLSGDYYLVYHGGRRRTVAFVGQSRRLKTDEEAFDLAADEVGIYEVNAVPLSTVEIPGSSAGGDGTVVPDTGPPSAGGGEKETPAGGDDPDATGGGESSEADRSPTEAGVEPSSDSPGAASGTDDTGGGSSPDRPEIDLDAALNPGGTDERTEDDGGDEDATDPSPASPFGGAGPADPADPEELDASEVGEALPAEQGSPVDPGAGEEPRRDDETPDGTGTTTVESSISAVPEDETVGPGEAPPEPPSLGVSGPAGEATPEDVEAAAAAESELETGTGTGSRDESERDADPDDGTGTATGGAEDVDSAQVVPSIDPDRTARAEMEEEGGAADRQVIDGETVAGLRSELSARETRIEELRERLESVEAAREELAAERDRLEERVSELERRLEESGAAPMRNTREVPPTEALSATNVLVRYRSKGEPTLADAHDGGANREALAENLVLEPHPSFDTEDVSVSGRTYDAFLKSTRAYGFLRWLVGEFVYEIRDTGSTDALKPLYDALPSLDRVEFDATVTLEGADRETARFDLVGRDRRGNPLLVALLEDERAPTNATTMREFVRSATAAAESHGSLVGALAVTASYFEPAALEMVEEATAGSLLSRSKRKSFVSTSRKGGYHLCLVEDREDSFYLSEPEL